MKYDPAKRGEWVFVPPPKSLAWAEKPRKTQHEDKKKKTFRDADYLVKEVPKGFVAFAFVADLRGRDPAGAGVDVSRAIFLARIIEVACFGGVQAVVFFGGCGLS